MSAKDPQNPKKQWTVLLYMAGDNNLSEECVYSLVEAKLGLSDKDSDKLAVLAQFDPAGVRAQTKRYRLRPPPRTLNQDADETGWTVSEGDTGEPQSLLEFVRWGISECPAEHYMLVLVGHGSGTDDDFLLRDDNPPDALSISELCWVFDKLKADGHTIDILGFDTCLMNMAEVCFELLRTNVTYMVGSEGYSPNTGWPYKNILKLFVEHIGQEPEWLASQIVQEYTKFYEPYTNGGISVDQSVLEVKKIDEVKRKMFTLVETLMGEFDRGDLSYNTMKQNALLLAHWEAQSYNGEVFVDLYDFCNQLAARYQQLIDQKVAVNNEVIGARCEEVIEKCKGVLGAIEALVIRSCAAGAAFQYSSGLSIYFPWAALSQSYGNLAFARETRWVDFLDRYHVETRRRGRTTPPPPPGARQQPDSPFRASVPTNRGRNGYVESMRNPPTKEYNQCRDIDASERSTNYADNAPETGDKTSETKRN